MTSWQWWVTPGEPRWAYLVYMVMVMFVFMATAAPLWADAGTLSGIFGTLCGYMFSHFIVRVAMGYDGD